MPNDGKDVFPDEVRAGFQAAVRRALSGQRDAEEMRRACERMDQMREAIRRQHGQLDIGVPALRELRGSGAEQ